MVRCAQWHIHQLEQGIEYPLSHPRHEVENPLEHQEGTDGLVSVKQATASASTQKVNEPRLSKDLFYLGQLVMG